MKYANHTRGLWRAVVCLPLVMLSIGAARPTQAQWVPKWLNIGDLQSRYFSGGASPEADEIAWSYPGIHPRSAYIRWKGLWISGRSVKDEDGKTWPIRISHVGPRSTGVGEVFDVSHKLVARYENPSVKVDGRETFAEPVVVDEVDPTLAPDREVASIVNTSVGVTMERKAMQWSHPDHDGYHIIEYTFTNTGNVDKDEDIEVENGAIQDVYFTFLDRGTGGGAFSGAWDNSAGGVAWGQYTMNDAVGDGLSDYGVDFRAQFSWLGNIKETAGLAFNTLGNPMWTNHQWNSIADDTLGRLNSANFSGIVTIHADAAAHADGAASPDDRAQPRTMTYLNSDFGDMTSGSDHNNEPKMLRERTWIECGSTPLPSGGIATLNGGDCSTPRSWPTQARLVQGQTTATPRNANPDFANQTADPTRGGGGGGWGFMSSYGPYDMAPGQQVRIVVAEAVAGLDEDFAVDLGRAYKLSKWNDAVIHQYDANHNGRIDADEAMTKNQWVMSARDSLFKTFQGAINNYRGGLNAPHPPAPPTSFEVTSGTDKIELTWSGPAPAAWEVWRAQKHYSGIVTALQVSANGLAVPDLERKYKKVADLPGSATSYDDANVVRGGSYYYYLQARNAGGLKSSRYYAQTYNAAFLRRPAGQDLSGIRIVPNPYHLGSDPALRLDVKDRMAFYGLPPVAKIEIYSELGELVRTIDHTDGSGDEFWDMTTSSRQLVVSGVYIAVITDEASGAHTMQNFIVIR